jgi:hypothetical protein
MMRRAKSNRTPLDAVGKQLTTFKAFPATKQPESDSKPFVPGPNPELEEFVRQHMIPYNPDADDYDASAFDRDLIVHKHNKLYTLHLYWSKKDPLSIGEYIKHYTKPGDLVLDPYCGAGTTGCATLIEGRHALLVDVSLSAAFLPTITAYSQTLKMLILRSNY